MQAPSGRRSDLTRQARPRRLPVPQSFPGGGGSRERHRRSLGEAFRRLVLLGAGAALVALLLACETGAYPLDIFPEMHYQQSYRPQEPPRAEPPEGQVPVSGAEEPLTDFVATLALENPKGLSGESIDQGRRLYVTNCAMCHGDNADGESFVAERFSTAGDKPPPPLRSDSISQQQDGALFWTISNGVNRMPAWKRLLTADERWALVTYIRSLQ